MLLRMIRSASWIRLMTRWWWTPGFQSRYATSISTLPSFSVLSSTLFLSTVQNPWQPLFSCPRLCSPIYTSMSPSSHSPESSVSSFLQHFVLCSTDSPSWSASWCGFLLFLLGILGAPYLPLWYSITSLMSPGCHNFCLYILFLFLSLIYQENGFSLFLTFCQYRGVQYKWALLCLYWQNIRCIYCAGTTLTLFLCTCSWVLTAVMMIIPHS